MLVYGDWIEPVDPAEELSKLSSELRAIAGMNAGIDRHAKLVGALMVAGQLLQGVADRCSPASHLSDLVDALARSFVRSFDTDFEQLGELPRVSMGNLPERVHLRLPEGFAFYTVYPESYLKAARRLKLHGTPRVIGIRSIGTTLGAVVAAAIDAAPPFTVRPIGDPFNRMVELPRHVIERDAHYVIVDEGPGLSGSSFGAVADCLEANGIPLERIAFLPSHGGDLGPRASAVHRARWQRAQRVAATFDPSFLERRVRSLQPFAAGGVTQRTKYRGRRNGTDVLLKFAGIGWIGERKLQIARTLHAAGLTPEPIGLLYGFLVERWCTDAQPIAVDDVPVDEIGRYVGARARLLPAPSGSGATIEELLTMCRRNIALALGDARASTVDRIDIRGLEQRLRRVRTDNKVQREKWLRTKRGSLLKTDALDHHRAHDLIGCQGVEWDIAGVTHEFALDDRDQARLIRAVGLPVDVELLDFYRIAFAAFRVGEAELSGERAAAQRYARSLEHLLLRKS